MRDYLYIPLGGNRDGEFNTYRNLFLTMLIGGLWHGANWTFVVWGAYHGVILGLHRRFSRYWDPLPALFRRIAMFFFAVVGWVFFRATTFTMAMGLFRRMCTPVMGDGVVQPGVFGVLIAVAIWWGMIGPNTFDIDKAWVDRLRRAFALAAAFGAALGIMAGAGSSPFLYFQF